MRWCNPREAPKLKPPDAGGTDGAPKLKPDAGAAADGAVDAPEPSEGIFGAVDGGPALEPAVAVGLDASADGESACHRRPTAVPSESEEYRLFWFGDCVLKLGVVGGAAPAAGAGAGAPKGSLLGAFVAMGG